jgi:hypothetical protein
LVLGGRDRDRGVGVRGSGPDRVDGFPSYLLGVIVRTAMQKFDERPSAEEFVDALEQA